MDDGLQPLADALAVDPRTVLRALGGGWGVGEVSARDWPRLPRTCSSPAVTRPELGAGG